ncbi:hypothetical protein H2201_008107, partial [Coniosporium apollinis]
MSKTAVVWVHVVSSSLCLLAIFLDLPFIAHKVACVVSAIISRLRPADVAPNSTDPGSTGAIPEPEAEDDMIAVVREHVRKRARSKWVWYMFILAQLT